VQASSPPESNKQDSVFDSGGEPNCFAFGIHVLKKDLLTSLIFSKDKKTKVYKA